MTPMIDKTLLENYAEQIKAIKAISPILEKILYPHISKDELRFGGGTALAIYYYQHRLSFDLDFFVSDCQYLDLIRPKLWIDDYSSFSSEYSEQAHHIGVMTDKTKIDFLSSHFYANPLLDNSKEIFTCDIYIEAIEDIIAKKITFRKQENKARDIVDIAVVLQDKPNLFENLLDLGVIEKSDLKILSDKLLDLNLEKYHKQVQIIQPISQYQDVAHNAPQLLLQSLKKLVF